MIAHPHPADAPADPRLLVTLATQAAAIAGDYLREAVNEQQAVDIKSSRTDLVTAADRHVETLLVETLRAARPDDGFVGEEGTDQPGTSGVRWVIDPIDGTTNFFYGLAGFNVSIAAVCEGGTLAGVVLDPLRRELFAATAGGGATCNDRPIRCSTATDLTLALVATGFGYAPEARKRQAEILQGVLPGVRDIRRLGAAALDLCLVAAGRVDAYFERGLAPWDHAAGALIATEAGARVGDFHGGPPSAELVIAAPPALWAPLTALLAQAGETGAGALK